jgi:hypothetical protein
MVYFLLLPIIVHHNHRHHRSCYYDDSTVLLLRLVLCYAGNHNVCARNGMQHKTCCLCACGVYVVILMRANRFGCQVVLGLDIIAAAAADDVTMVSLASIFSSLLLFLRCSS